MLYKEHGNEKANLERGKVNKLLQSIQKRKKIIEMNHLILAVTMMLIEKFLIRNKEENNKICRLTKIEKLFGKQE